MITQLFNLDLNSIKMNFNIFSGQQQLPDLNIIKPRADILIKDWGNIPLEIIQKLYDSVPRRIEPVLKANDGRLSY